jgi:hypothetical protein
MKNLLWRISMEIVRPVSKRWRTQYLATYLHHIIAPSELFIEYIGELNRVYVAAFDDLVARI